MELFLKKFTSKYNTAPFSEINLADYKEGFEKTIELARAEIDAIANNSAAPTFENTIEALDFSGDALDRLSSIFFNRQKTNRLATTDRVGFEPTGACAHSGFQDRAVMTTSVPIHKEYFTSNTHAP